MAQPLLKNLWWCNKNLSVASASKSLTAQRRGLWPSAVAALMFVDEVEVSLSAGSGGHGCLSFRREKYIPFGGPNGGDGGDGGSVILTCDRNVGDLVDYKYTPHASAKNGQPGMGSQCHGRNGANCLLRVPEGTVVHHSETKAIAAELLRHGESVTLLKGGKGGLGNVHFKSSTDRAPRKTIPGKPGESGKFRFEMKVIADIGLVGFPNAGKSSLINAITETERPTGPYPFTTLYPKVGVARNGERTFTIADIPGIIGGAHANRGLGFRFLRHVERCPILLFVIDIGSVDGRSPWDDFTTLRDELAHYGAGLADRPFMVCTNKMDVGGARENFSTFSAKSRLVEPLPISCATGMGLDELQQRLLALIDSQKAR
ncbi:MAG: GTPase ObgE [Puniceicoccales bacterium]|jgi:GTP-binding protein|nr:GTPase ObgE [Puniceicoccales bacterium]